MAKDFHRRQAVAADVVDDLPIAGCQPASGCVCRGIHGITTIGRGDPSRAVLMERLDPLCVVAAAKLNHPHDLLGLDRRERRRATFHLAGYGPTGLRSARPTAHSGSDLPESEPDGGNAQIVCGLHGMFQRPV